jgi:hypothetical protein
MKKTSLPIFLILLCSAQAYSQGFGVFSRKVATVNRLLPPTVNLNGKRIRVDSFSADIQGGDQLKSLLKTELVTLIQKDPRFILNETSPETVLKFTVTRFYVERWTGAVVNGQQTVSYRGKIEVAYQAIDTDTNSALDSEILSDETGFNPTESTKWSDLLHSSSNSKKKMAAEASENEARDQLINDIVNKMGKRIAPLDEPFDAPLPAGKLESLSNLALSRRWGAMEEQGEKMDPLPKGAEDTYRLYLVALSKEAQAYDLTREANDRDLGKRTDITAEQAENDYKRAQKYLDEAGAIYKQIIAANPKEKEFRPGDTRTEEAISIYAMIDRYKEEYAKAQAAKAAQAAQTAMDKSAGRRAPTNASAGQTPLEQILSFCSSGLALDSIRDYIDSPDFVQDAKATGYKFNFAKDPIRLNEICKQSAGTIQKLMRTRLTTQTSHK